MIARLEAAALEDSPYPRSVVWLLRHQDPDGRWDPAGFGSCCRGERCRGEGDGRYAVAVTSVVLIHLARCGYAESGNQLQGHVDAALRWLVSRQDGEGLIGEREEPHAFVGHLLATLVLSDCLFWGSVSSQEKEPARRSSYRTWLERPLQRAVSFILAARNPDHAWGFGPGNSSHPLPTSLAVLALASLRFVFDIKNSHGLSPLEPGILKEAVDFLERSTDAEKGGLADSTTLTALAHLAASWAGYDSRARPVMCRWAEYLHHHPPLRETRGERDDPAAIAAYAITMVHIGGTYSRDAYRVLETWFKANPSGKEGCAGGSWAPLGLTGCFGGRIATTALLGMACQTPWLYWVDAAPARPLIRPEDRKVLTARAEDLPGTEVALHAESPISPGRNLLWCAAGQLAWNELMALTGGPVRLEPHPPLADLLNRRDVTRDQAPPQGLVALAGTGREGILERIRTEQARAGGGAPNLLPDRDEKAEFPPDWAAFYAWIACELPFARWFDLFGLDFQRAGPEETARRRVLSFGMESYDPSLAKQVRVLWHRFAGSEAPENQEFVIELVTTHPECRLLVAKVPPEATLAATIAAAMARVAGKKPRHPAESELESSETLRIPVLDFDLTRDFGELLGRRVMATGKAFDGLPILMARQRLRFRLDEKGASVSSGFSGLIGCRSNRRFHCDRPFLVLLLRREATAPFLALWVANPELMVPLPEEKK